MWVELPLGRPQAALEVLDAGLVLAAEHPRRAVRIRFCRAYVLGELGREDEVEDELGEVLQTARRLGDAWMLAYVEWQRMISASLRGDAEATVHHARQAEAQGGEWWSVEGAEFLAEAADCLDRVGSAALAADCLERAKREPQKARAPIGMAECALLARHGDPELALARLAAVHGHGIAPREYWRVTLLQAYAAFRLGEGGAGALAAQAFEQAAALGQPRAPLLRERELTEALLALAADTGLPAAKALVAASLPIAVSVLGRFELTRGGRRVPLGAGQEARLLKLVAACGGRVHVEQAIEGLWPEVERDAGRNRLRTVLNRLRDVTPDTVGREGEHLCLGPDVRLDLAHFHAEAREALALGTGGEAGAAAIAQCAIARYRGALLPNDPYEEWAEAPRESARRAVLELLDLCAEIAVRRGDLDEARRMVERTVELAPYDDHRYLRVASILHEQGRKGAALSVLSRARSALAQLGIDLPAPLVELERTVVAGEARHVAPETATF
jgi:DNA-binding SARP family transcriptional activator